ncbi:MAG: hypothetical protein AAF655_14570 [Bacteroidota bacterium]
MAKHFLLIFCCLSLSMSCILRAQNTGLGTSMPTHTLHIVPDPENLEPDPIRIDSLQYYQTLSDTAVLVTDPARGVIRYMPVSLIGSDNKNWMYDANEGYLIGRSALQAGHIVVFSDSGRIGIGSTSPTHPLHVIANEHPVRLEGLQEKINPTQSLLVTGMDGILYTTPIDSLTPNTQWTTKKVNGRSWLYPRLPFEQGDSLLITEGGRLLLGNMGFVDEKKAIHVLATFDSEAEEKQTEIATEYSEKQAGTILKADGGIKLYRTKDLLLPHLTGYIDFHSGRNSDYDIRLAADTTHKLVIQEGALAQQLSFSENLNPAKAYVGGAHFLQASTLSDSINMLTGVQGWSHREGDGYTTLLQGGNFQTKELADHNGTIQLMQGLESGIYKYGAGKNTQAAQGVSAYITAQSGASGNLKDPVGTHTGVSLEEGSEVEIIGTLRSIHAYVHINTPANSQTIPHITGIEASLSSSLPEQDHQAVTTAEVMQLGHNENFHSQEDLYGLRITDIYGGGGNNYAIYTAEGKVRFGDVIQQGESFAEDNYAISWGVGDSVFADRAMAVGLNNYIGKEAHESLVVGRSHTLRGAEGAMATGFQHQVSSDAAFVSGEKNRVEGEAWNTVFGYNNHISGNSAMATIVGGSASYASSNYGLVVGEGDTLTAEASAVFGRHNVVDGAASLVAGTHNYLNGTGSTSSNLLVGTDNVLGDGVAAVWESAIMGKGNIISGARSFILGEENTVEADYGNIIGLRSQVTGSRGMALGTEVAASSDQLVMGFQSGVFLKDGNPNITSAPAGHSGLISDGGELYALDANGNKTGISPHHFPLIPQGPSEPLAWAYYSEKNGQAINVDMTRVIRLVEQLSGEQLIYQEGGDEPLTDTPQNDLHEMRMEAEIAALKDENEQLQNQLSSIKQILQKLQEQVKRLERQ